jgi:hypothetical protein
MAYDDGLAQVFRDDLADVHGVSEKKMFGGLCFLFYGHMLCGVHQMRDADKNVTGDGAMFRVGPANYETALAVTGVRELSFTGRPMKGLVECDAELLEDDQRRAKMISLATQFAQSLPPK